MKRMIVLIICLVLLFCSCGRPQTEETGDEKYANIASSGIWISFSEINRMLVSNQGFETELGKAVENCAQLGIDNIYIHVRSYCDSLYPSEYFPLIDKANNCDYDVFEKIITAFHEKNIKVHAWINPYRVLTSSDDIEDLNHDSPAYKWLKDSDPDNDLNVCFYKGIYLNPSQSEVRRLILDGIKEIIASYDVDGIHFDDYFYPTQTADFDKESYDKYIEETQVPLSLDDWRRANVNALISSCYSAIKYQNEDIEFSVSPAASLSKNYDEYYADIEEWIEGGYIDTIIPQLYFGFEYKDPDFRFDSLLEEWKTVCRDTDVKLLIGLGPYKIGTDAEADGTEWQTDTDIIARQAEMCYKDSIAEGYVLFSYSFVFSDEELNIKQKDNLLRFINSANSEVK